MSLMFQPLKKYADFTGRARRTEFWLFSLFIFIVEIIYVVAMGAVGGFNPEPGGATMAVAGIFSLFFLAMLIPSIAVGVRRLHDTNRSGWWLLLSFIPLIGGLVLLIFYVLPGAPGPNPFGADPKAAAGDAAGTVFS